MVQNKRDMKHEKRKELFFNVVERLKSYGYKVYTGRGTIEQGFLYGYTTNGTGVLYFQINDLGILSFSIEYWPSYKMGSGIRAEVNIDDKDSVDNALNTRVSGVRMYKNFEVFRDHHWQALIEL